MKVVLRRDVPNLGKAGEIKEVADGYGRNYLIPRGLAAPATRTAMENVEARKAAETRQHSRLRSEHEALAQRIADAPLTVRAHTGQQGRLYGSITSADIAEALSRALGRPVDKRQIALDEPIRQLGDHSVRIHVAPSVTADLTVVVQPEQG
ncbi:MAG: 50S ribosomal protein L9 [Chloroflexi bacterium]|nr:50S ribosomal protein L9 [Chloroflexota bacterium]